MSPSKKKRPRVAALGVAILRTVERAHENGEEVGYIDLA
jgi:hypothetical protein